jgi:hypothetical protein
MALGTGDPLSKFASNTMLTQTVTHNFVTETISNTFGFTNLWERTTFFRLAADRVFFAGAFPASGQEATHNYVSEIVSNTIGFAGITGYDQERDITQYLGFTPRTFKSLGNSFQFIFNEHVGVLTLLPVTNTMLTDDVERWYNATNTMLTDAVVGVSFEDVYNDFELADVTDSTDTDPQRGPTHSVIKQSVAFSISGVTCPEKEYTPYVGDGPSDIPAPSVTPPTLGTGTLTMLVRDTPAVTVTMKNPEFGNTDTITFAQIDRVTRGGDRKVFADIDWVDAQTFRLTVTRLCDVDAEAMVDFLNNSLGHVVILTDWENRQWAGLIITPETNVINDLGGMTVEIVFEGVPTVYP